MAKGWGWFGCWKTSGNANSEARGVLDVKEGETGVGFLDVEDGGSEEEGEGEGGKGGMSSDVEGVDARSDVDR